MKIKVEKKANKGSKEKINIKIGKYDSISDIFKSIPDNFWNIGGFIFMMLMLLILCAEEVYRLFSMTQKYGIFNISFFFIGSIAEIFATLYIFSQFYKEEKFSLKKILKNNVWDILLFAMLIWSAVSTYTADNLYVATKGTWYRKDGFYTYLIYAAMYVCGKAVTSDRFRRYILRTFSTVCTLLSLWVLFQYNGHIYNMFGRYAHNMDIWTKYASIFYNTNHYAYFMTLAIMAMVGLIIIEEKLIYKVIFLAMFVFNLWALIINDTFGGYIAVMAGIIFVSIIFIIKDRKKLVPIILICLTFIITSVCVDAKTHILSNDFGVTYGDAKAGISNDAGGTSRIGLWKQAFRFMKDRPVFGYGPDGLWSLYYEKGFSSDRPHNEFIQHAVYLGIPAALMYIGAILSLFIYCIKRIKKLNVLMLTIGGMVCAYLVSSFFGNTRYYTAPYYFMTLGMLSACHRKDAL